MSWAILDDIEQFLTELVVGDFRKSSTSLCRLPAA